jgi:hypothetical protein
MLKGKPETLDLKAKAKELVPLISNRLDEIKIKFGAGAVERLDPQVQEIHYPVSQYLTKISSFNFDKTDSVSGVLLGIKGQYLIFETGVINMRKFSSYQISIDY